MKWLLEWWCQWTHDALGWHNGDGRVGFDGISATSTCSRCGKRVLRDSNGDWF